MPWSRIANSATTNPPCSTNARLFDCSPAMIDLAEPFGRDRRADRGGSQTDDDGQPDSCEDHRQGERQLDADQPPAGAHAHASRRFQRQRRNLRQAG